ncbi:MAG: TIGR03960 family B12-binding radical SAM protein [Bacillota bacterium]
MTSLERILARVEKPARYVGGEFNAVVKDWDKTPVRIAFAFPDVYEVGMSHLGLHILYHVVNSREDALMERVFAPWIDMEREMRREGLPLFTLESHRSLADFDVVAFTLQYELSYSNVLNMLDLAGIPPAARDRRAGMPLVVAGGPCAFNPEPLAPFLDAVFLGEGEEGLHDLIEVVQKHNQAHRSREELLRALAGIPGVYVPRFYRPEYAPDGTLAGVRPVESGIPDRVRKRVVQDLDRVPFPTRPIVPYLEAVHDRAMLEVFRGCTRGCRFCQAGAIYRPVREKNPETLLAQAAELLKNTGYNELSLTSLSTTDYSRIRELVGALVDRHQGEQVNVSLPSLRVDAFAVELARAVQAVRKSSLTFAPEAGSQRLRDVINKQVTEEDLLRTVGAAFTAGWYRVKLYFMLGLPTETLEDIAGIARLARRVLERGRECGVAKGRLNVTVSTSSFVPKPHTPFQWEAQTPLPELRERQAFLQGALKGKNLVYRGHEPETSFLEAVFARGDRRLGPALTRARELGCRMDGWRECFRFDLWQRAFSETGIDPGAYAYREYRYTDVLPWDHLDTGVDRDYLVAEHQRALAGETTPDCRGQECAGCGLCPGLEVEPRLAEAGSGAAS